MHPRMMSWGRGRSCCVPSDTGHHHHAHYADPGFEGGGGFGVRRPLRFLAWRLELSDEQVAKLAGVLQALKTERAQTEVDDRRGLAALADAVAGETFDEARAAEAVAARARSAARLQEHVKQALAAMHALLEPPQRERLAYLIRTGSILL